MKTECKYKDLRNLLNIQYIDKLKMNTVTTHILHAYFQQIRWNGPISQKHKLKPIQGEIDDLNCTITSKEITFVVQK